MAAESDCPNCGKAIPEGEAHQPTSPGLCNASNGGVIDIVETDFIFGTPLTLVGDALQLCWAIEKLPASEQQTKCIVMASALLQRLRLES